MTNIKKTVSHTTSYLTSIHITSVNSEYFFKAIGRPNILLTTTFAGYQIVAILLPHFKNPLLLYFGLVAKQVKSGETNKKFLQMSLFLLHSFIEHLLCLVVLGNNYGGKIFLKFLFFCMTLTRFCEKISTIC